MSTDLRDLGRRVKRLQMRHHRAANAALADLDVSIVQWDALRNIAESPGASLHDLAQLTFQTDQAFGALAARMEARGLITRTPGPGRAVRLLLTEQGERLRDQGAARLAGVMDDSFSVLSSQELETLDTLLAKLIP